MSVSYAARRRNCVADVTSHTLPWIRVLVSSCVAEVAATSEDEVEEVAVVAVVVLVGVAGMSVGYGPHSFIAKFLMLAFW